MRHSSIIFIAALLHFGCISTSSRAADLTIDVKNTSGAPITDVAVYAEPLSGQSTNPRRTTVTIEQKGRKFLPLVSVIQTGTEISFPNNDSVRHHVYSFSPAKSFELKLYSGVPGTPVNFDKSGTVVVGCNIHDKMIAYIHAVPTPYFAKTDSAGKAILAGLPPGKYRLKAWHYDLPQTAPMPEQLITVAADNGTASFRLDAKAVTALQ